MVLQDLSKEQLIARLEKAEAKAKRKLTIKVSEKGAVSVYGLGRFPMTLYKSQWLQLITLIPQVSQFIDENADQLTEKE